jgi:hypothetical protein
MPDVVGAERALREEDGARVLERRVVPRQPPALDALASSVPGEVRPDDDAVRVQVVGEVVTEQVLVRVAEVRERDDRPVRLQLAERRRSRLCVERVDSDDAGLHEEL